ncbi:MAG: redox-regulated ATPase YchF [Deltaproteobacteria bacterium]|nr:redox-regulated ATPase YchF [Deltaproteobacteria bacterium]
MRVGIIGYSGSGKTTLFNALTGLSAATGFGGKGKANLGVIKVPDPRVVKLAEIFKPKKTTFSEISFVDLPAAARGSGETWDPKALAELKTVEAFVHVVKGFDDGAGKTDPESDLRALEAEFVLADLLVAEKRIERLRKDHSNPTELKTLEGLHAGLSAERPVRDIPLSVEDERAVAGFKLLSQKPILVVVNVDESDLAPREIPPFRTLTLSAKVEAEVAALDAAERAEFLSALGIEEPARDRFVRAAFALLDLIAFLTTGEDECRAWTIRRGTPAVRAAGKIHSDIERGFIRAEVVPYETFIQLGSDAKCREAGKMRLEGKEYVVTDGDIIHFRFNV